MRVVSKWNPHRRLLRAVARRTSGVSSSSNAPDTSKMGHFGTADIVSDSDDAEEYIEIVPDAGQNISGTRGRGPNPLPSKKRTITREAILRSLPSPGKLAQTSASHLDLLHALAYPKRNNTSKANEAKASAKTTNTNKEPFAGQASRVVSTCTPVPTYKGGASTPDVKEDTDVENNDEDGKACAVAPDVDESNIPFVEECDSFAAAAASLTPSLTDDVDHVHDLSNMGSSDDNDSAILLNNNEVNSCDDGLAERRDLGIC